MMKLIIENKTLNVTSVYMCTQWGFQKYIKIYSFIWRMESKFYYKNYEVKHFWRKNAITVQVNGFRFLI